MIDRFPKSGDEDGIISFSIFGGWEIGYPMEYRILDGISDIGWNIGYLIEYRLFDGMSDIGWNIGYWMEHRIFDRVSVI